MPPINHAVLSASAAHRWLACPPSAMLEKELPDETTVYTLSGKMIYNYVDKNMPEWARPTIQKMMDKGFLQGDENGCLGLTDELLRVFVTNDRAGLYNHRWDGKSE